MKPDGIPARFLHDEKLQPRRLPALQGDLSDAAGWLQLSGETRAEANVTLAGRRAAAAGTEVSGLRDVWIQARRVAKGITVESFKADSIAVLPGFVQRRDRALDERVCLPRELGAVLWQWKAMSARQLDVDWTVEQTQLPDRAGTLRWNHGERWLLIEQDIQSALYCFDRAVRFEVQDQTAGLRVRASVALQMGDTVTFAVAATPSATALADLTLGLDDVSALPRARQAAWNRLERERVNLHTPFAQIDNAWRWALYRLDSFLADAGSAHMMVTGMGCNRDALHFRTFDAVHAALAALSTGDFQSARQVIEFLAGTQNSNGAIAQSGTLTGTCDYGDDESTLLFLLLVARHFAWCGDIGFTRKVWPHVRRAFGDKPAIVSPVVWRELAIAAEAIGEAADSRAFKVQGEQGAAAENEPAWPWQTYLPGSGPLDERWITHLRGELEQQRGAWRALAASAPDDRGCPDHALSTALAVSPLMYGLLGAVPDAARYRIELRPVIPHNWDILDILGLRVGDNRLSLQYRRVGGKHTFVLRPLEGMVPLRVILEPALLAASITGVTVDGQPAVLDVRRRDERWICPLQIVLDHERTIVVQTVLAEGA